MASEQRKITTAETGLLREVFYLYPKNNFIAAFFIYAVTLSGTESYFCGDNRHKYL